MTLDPDLGIRNWARYSTPLEEKAKKKEREGRVEACRKKYLINEEIKQPPSDVSPCTIL